MEFVELLFWLLYFIAQTYNVDLNSEKIRKKKFNFNFFICNVTLNKIT